MKNSPPKIVVARLTARKLNCFLHGGGASAKREATSTSGGRKVAYWNALRAAKQSRMQSAWNQPVRTSTLRLKVGALKLRLTLKKMS